MITENIHALASYRLEQADECLDAAKLLLEKKPHGGAIKGEFLSISIYQ